MYTKKNNVNMSANSETRNAFDQIFNTLHQDDLQSQALSKDMLCPTVAFWCDMLNAGVFIAQNGRCGSYGNGDINQKVIDKYMESHEEFIRNTIASGEFFYDIGEMAQAILLYCIIDILRFNYC